METLTTFGSAWSFELTQVIARLYPGNEAPGLLVDNRYKDCRRAGELEPRRRWAVDFAETVELLFLEHRGSRYRSLDEAIDLKEWGDDAMFWGRGRTPLWVWFLALIGAKSVWVRRREALDPRFREREAKFRKKLNEAFAVWRDDDRTTE